MLFIPFIIFSAVRIGRRVRSTTRTGQDQLADVQNILHETITGNRIVKAFGMESWEVARFRNAAQRLFRANLRSVAAAAISSPLMDIFGAIAIALLLLLGREQIAHNELTLGAFIAFVAAVLSMYNPVRKFAVFNNSFQQALGASSQLFKFMDTEDVVTREARRQSSAALLAAASSFENVSFSYQSDGDDSREILRDIDLEVKRGEILADRRFQRRREEHPGSPASPLLRCLRRTDSGRRPRCPRRHALVLALADRHRDPGNGPVQRYRSQQHRLRPAPCSA